MARTGRPKVDKPMKRIVTVKFQEDEYQRMLDYVKRHQISISQMIRNGIDMQIERSQKK